MNLNEQHKDAIVKLVKIEKDLEHIKATKEKMISGITTPYNNKIRALEIEMSQKISEVEEDAKRKIEALSKDKEIYLEINRKMKRFMDLMHIAKSNPIRHETKVYYYSHKNKVYIDPIKTIYEDEYTKASLFIVPNDNSVKCYTLIIRGYSIFGDLLRGTCGGYVPRIHEEHYNINAQVKTAATEQELIDYINRKSNQKRILAMLPENLDDIINIYEPVKEVMDEPEWHKAYLKSRKHYYEEHYSGGTETPEYKAIIKELNSIEKKGKTKSKKRKATTGECDDCGDTFPLKELKGYAYEEGVRLCDNCYEDRMNEDDED